MDTFQHALQYALDPKNDFLGVLATHLRLSALALLLAAAIGIPLRILVSRYGVLARVVVNVVGIVRVVPSIAVLFLLRPSQGIGFRPSAIAPALLAIPPRLINPPAGRR